MAQTIFLCQFQMPFPKIASWPNMYNFYLDQFDHAIDIIICPPVERRADNVTYYFSEDVLKEKGIVHKVTDKVRNLNRFQSYLDALDQAVSPGNKYVLKLVDNSGLAIALDAHLRKNYNRKDFHILYYFQGFAPMFSPREEEPFMLAVDELLFLTKLAYQDWKQHHNQMPLQTRVVHNACDPKLFFKVSRTERATIRESLGIDTKYVFLWCSQDRPKKGLEYILRVWQKLPKEIRQASSLLVVGVNTEIDIEGVRVIGRVPNNELARYYQTSDFYLFPSLWKEGFGIVLAEALMCGCYCIGSDYGGIPEVLGHGTYGRLVADPNFIDSWVATIIQAVDEFNQEGGKNPYLSSTDGLYDVNEWALTMNQILEEAGLYLDEKIPSTL